MLHFITNISMELFIIIGFFLGIALFKDYILRGIDPSIAVSCTLHSWERSASSLRCTKCGKTPNQQQDLE